MMINIFSGVLITLLFILLFTLFVLYVANIIVVNQTPPIWEKHESSFASTGKFTKEGKEIFRGLTIGGRGLYFTITGDSPSPRYNYVEFLKRSFFTNYPDLVVGFFHEVFVKDNWFKKW